jgi:hypothetical protein
MDMDAGDPGELSLPGAGKKNEKSSSRRLSSEEQQVTKKERRKNRGDKREKVFARRDNDEHVLTQRGRVLAIPPLKSSIRGNKRMEFVNRGFNAVISI